VANKYEQNAVGTIAKVEKHGRGYRAVTPTGEVLEGIENYVLRNNFRNRKAIRLVETDKGNLRWRSVPFADWSKAADTAQSSFTAPNDGELTQEALRDFLRDSIQLKPNRLKMSEVHWKYIIRAALKGDNLLFIGPSGCGKTMSAYAVQTALKRPFFYFNMGATQDPRSELIGNTHFAADKGTFVAESEFITAITTPNAIILLDEMSRAHPDASNILMTVLDKAQRYLRISEKPGSPIVKVAPGVSFFLTANVGSEYTGTRTMDRALFDRCKIVEVQPLDAAAETELLSETFPELDANQIKAVVNIACDTRAEVNTDAPKVGTIISTRVTLELASMIHDGFTLEEAAEVCIFPFYSNAGGAESERSHMKKIVQKYLPPVTSPYTAQSKLTNNPDEDEVPF
jgi:MoxR-like ATPase